MSAAAAISVVDRVAAVVNDDIVLQSEVYELGASYIADNIAKGKSRRAAEGEVLEVLIERKLVDQEVIKLGLEPNEQEIDRAADDAARRNGLDREGLKAELAKQGMSWESYRSEMKASLKEYKFAQVVLRPRITITDDELKDLWLRSGNAGQEEASLSALALKLPPNATPEQIAAVRARADEVVAKVKAGTPFAELAAAYDEESFKEQGGQMGTFARGKLVGALDQVAFSAPVGEATVVEFPGRVFVLVVTHRGAATTGFEQAKEELSNQIFSSRLEDEKERWFQQARRSAAIRILLPGGA